MSANNRRLLTVVALTAVIITAIVTAAIVYYSLRIRGYGKIKTIGVEAYADLECTKKVSEINWGTIPVGGSSQTTLYLKNSGNYPINLTISTENWLPTPAADYITLTWDYDGTEIPAGEVRGVILTLTVASDIIGVTDFQFDIVIRAGG